MCVYTIYARKKHTQMDNGHIKTHVAYDTYYICLSYY